MRDPYRHFTLADEQPTNATGNIDDALELLDEIRKSVDAALEQDTHPDPDGPLDSSRVVSLVQGLRAEADRLVDWLHATSEPTGKP